MKSTKLLRYQVPGAARGPPCVTGAPIQRSLRAAANRAERCAQCAVPALTERPLGTCEEGNTFDWKRQELERVYSHEDATSTERPYVFVAWAMPSLSGLRVVLPGEDASALRVQVGGGPKPPTQKEQKGEERHDDYYANVGDAIRTLREDVPTLFTSKLNFSIYREDIVFKDPRNCFHGMDNYKMIFWSLRFHGNLFFKYLYVEVKRIWQKTDDTICLRWTVHGLPRLPWDQEGTFDGVSTYKLDCHGKIYEHKVDNVIMGDPPTQRLPFLVTLNLVPAQQPYPTPWVRQCTSVDNVPSPPGTA